MDYYEIHSASLRDLQTEQAESCPAMFYSGNLIHILPGGALFKSNNTPGGNSLNADLQLTCLCADFGTDFDFDGLNQETFSYPGENGKLYRVNTTIVSPNGFQVKIMADSAAEGL